VVHRLAQGAHRRGLAVTALTIDGRAREAALTGLGVALGAKPDTFMGLSGLGDLVLTCTDNQSRNRRLGLLIAKGSDTQAAVKAIGSVVEGIPAARAARDVATRAQVDMPIVLQIYRVLYEHMDVASAVKALLDRQLKPEL
jgi:glycerol-3-phosphate dehydrogenase (NAD(P)+)